MHTISSYDSWWPSKIIFQSDNMVDCTESRRARMIAKIAKTKARVEKVVNRQGQNLMKKKNK